MKYIFLILLTSIYAFSSPIKFSTYSKSLPTLSGEDSDILARYQEDNFTFDFYQHGWRVTLFNNFQNDNGEQFLEYETIEFEVLGEQFEFEKQELIDSNLIYFRNNKYLVKNYRLINLVNDKYKFDFYEQNGNVKYDIMMSASNLEDLKIKINKETEVNDNSELITNAKLGRIISGKIIAYKYYNNSNLIPIEMNYKINENVISFESRSELNPDDNIIIDPVLIIESSYYGGLDDDRFYDAARDSEGNFYLTGITNSSGNIAFDGHQVLRGGISDAFLVKINPEGDREWATFYGGESIDIAFGVATNNGKLVIAGETSSQEDISTSGSHQEEWAGGSADGFIAYFDTDGELEWATYYGGSETDKLNTIALDQFGNVYAAGFTRSDNDVFFEGYQSTRNGDADAFFVKFNPLGERRWASYYGGDENDYFDGIGLDSDGNIYLTGSTLSENSISINGYQNSHQGKFDAFIVKLLPNGEPDWASYYGGQEDDFGNSISINHNDLLISGSTRSGGLVNGGNQTLIGGGVDGFYALFNTDGNFDHSSYYGGNQNDEIRGSHLTEDAIFISGFTRSTNNMTFNPLQEFKNAQFDGCFAKFNLDGEIESASYYGGNGSEEIRSIISSNDTIFFAGYTSSTDNIAQNGYQNNLFGSDDGFFVILQDEVSPKIIATFDTAYCAGSSYEATFSSENVEQDLITIKLELSDRFGSFENSTILVEGDYSSNETHNVAFEISENQQLGSNYKLRFLEEELGLESNASGLNILIIPKVELASGTGPFCEDRDYELVAKVNPGCTYDWVLPDGSIQENVSKIGINPKESGTFTYVLTQNGFGCTSEIEFDIEVFAKPVIDIIGPSSVCRFDTVNYKLDVDSDIEDISLWWEYSDVTVISGNPQINDNINFRINGDNPYVRVNVVRKADGCIASKQLNIDYFEVQEIEIIGTSSSCKDCSENYSIDYESNEYRWEVVNGEIIGESNQSSIEVKWGNASSGEIQVFAETPDGCTTVDGFFVTLSDNIVTQISPRINRVCKGSTQLFSTSSATFLENSWNVIGGEIIEETPNTIDVLWTGDQQGSVFLTQVNTNTSQTGTDDISLEIRDKVDLEISSEEVFTCLNTENQIIFRFFTGIELEAEIDNGRIIEIDGSGVWFEFDEIGEANLTVSANIAGDGCDTVRTFTYQVVENPSPPILSFDGMELKSDVPAIFIYNSSEILNETPIESFFPERNGHYNAYIINESGCPSDLSNRVFVTSLGISQLPERINIYPNPVSDLLNIESTKLIDIRVYSLDGLEVLTVNEVRSEAFDISDFESGFYLIEVKEGHNIYYHKLIKN